MIARISAEFTCAIKFCSQFEFITCNIFWKSYDCIGIGIGGGGKGIGSVHVTVVR